VNDFDLLHPALQHHLANSLGWKSLRPLQQHSIAPVLAGRHALMLAPTAGGKTEAAFFPILSRMLTENWSGLSVLYICPIKALLNNLEFRLTEYCTFVGRRCVVWHGDIAASVKSRVLADQPDCLLTTPESVEVLLTSKRANAPSLFRNLRAVIVDEVHAFAGDDRGWHLLAILERLTKLAGRELQRLGLSATVGNPDGLLNWLSGHCSGEGEVIAPSAPHAPEPNVILDYVGNLHNAATVISQLHRGEKRLVFCDSRARVEELAYLFRDAGVETYVSHSSLSLGERQQAEKAFNEGSNCVIVATSTLELGIDIGDLDRVIQIDAPPTVSSFLQRMGRTGRRAGSTRNCLCLATNRDSLLLTAGLLRLWSDGYVEPVVPPAQPFHIFAQQVMALALQRGGIGTFEWHEWVGRMPAFAAMSEEQKTAILRYMLEQGILNDDGGLLWFGNEGERAFGRRNFAELFSVFLSPPMFTVSHGEVKIGEVHESSFLVRASDRLVLLLGGRSWEVTRIEWAKRIAYVKPVQVEGKSRWLGSGQPLSYEICQAIRRVLVSTEESVMWSKRARHEFVAIRDEFDWLTEGETVWLRSPSNRNVNWWTFGGLRANAALAEYLRSYTSEVTFDNLALKFNRFFLASELEGAFQSIATGAPTPLPEEGLQQAIKGLKFSECLPGDLAAEMLRVRLTDSQSVPFILSESIRRITQ
jgi:ATP-dependent helicase Lhr and Lhr-like helicase